MYDRAKKMGVIITGRKSVAALYLEQMQRLWFIIINMQQNQCL